MTPGASVANGVAATARVITAGCLGHGRRLPRLPAQRPEGGQPVRLRSRSRSPSTPPWSGWSSSRQPWPWLTGAPGGSRSGSIAGYPGSPWNPHPRPFQDEGRRPRRRPVAGTYVNPTVPVGRPAPRCRARRTHDRQIPSWRWRSTPLPPRVSHPTSTGTTCSPHWPTTSPFTRSSTRRPGLEPGGRVRPAADLGDGCSAPVPRGTCRGTRPRHPPDWTPWPHPNDPRDPEPDPRPRPPVLDHLAAHDVGLPGATTGGLTENKGASPDDGARTQFPPADPVNVTAVVDRTTTTSWRVSLIRDSARYVPRRAKVPLPPRSARLDGDTGRVAVPGVRKKDGRDGHEGARAAKARRVVEQLARYASSSE